MDIDQWVLTHSRLSRSIVGTQAHSGVRTGIVLRPRHFPRNQNGTCRGSFLSPPHASSLLESKCASCERCLVRDCIKIPCSCLHCRPCHHPRSTRNRSVLGEGPCSAALSQGCVLFCKLSCYMCPAVEPAGVSRHASCSFECVCKADPVSYGFLPSKVQAASFEAARDECAVRVNKFYCNSRGEVDASAAELGRDQCVVHAVWSR